MQRALAAKNLTHARAGCILAGYLKFLPVLVFISLNFRLDHFLMVIIDVFDDSSWNGWKNIISRYFYFNKDQYKNFKNQ